MLTNVTQPTEQARCCPPSLPPSRCLCLPRSLAPSLRLSPSLSDAEEAVQVVDARSTGRFNGTAPEPRPGLRGGHIPGSRSVPFDQVRPDPVPAHSPRVRGG
jgi:hypothetical protein